MPIGIPVQRNARAADPWALRAAHSHCDRRATSPTAATAALAAIELDQPPRRRHHAYFAGKAEELVVALALEQNQPPLGSPATRLMVFPGEGAVAAEALVRLLGVATMGLPASGPAGEAEVADLPGLAAAGDEEESCRGQRPTAASAQTQRCGCAEPRHPRDDRIPEERSWRRPRAGDAFCHESTRPSARRPGRAKWPTSALAPPARSRIGVSPPDFASVARPAVDPSDEICLLADL